MRVLVCGTRTFSDEKFIFEVLDEYHAASPITLIIEGEARGADTIARLWAESRDVEVAKFPAKWDVYGRAAGPIRNAVMLQQKPDLVMGFYDVEVVDSKGTKDMCSRARAAGVDVLEYVVV